LNMSIFPLLGFSDQGYFLSTASFYMTDRKEAVKLLCNTNRYNPVFIENTVNILLT
jgi:hypothetical protein